MDDAVEEEGLPVGVILLFGLNSRLKIVRLLVLWHFVPDWLLLPPRWIMVQRLIRPKLAETAFVSKAIVQLVLHLIVDDEWLLLHFEEAFHFVCWAEGLLHYLVLVPRKQVFVPARVPVQKEVFEHLFDLWSILEVAYGVVRVDPSRAGRPLRLMKAFHLEITFTLDALDLAQQLTSLVPIAFVRCSLPLAHFPTSTDFYVSWPALIFNPDKLVLVISAKGSQRSCWR